MRRGVRVYMGACVLVMVDCNHLNPYSSYPPPSFDNRCILVSRNTCLPHTATLHVDSILALSLTEHNTLHTRPDSSYLDFPALFKRSCSTPGSYLCSDRYLCEVNISASLVKAFPDVFGPMEKQGVTARSTCTWNPFPVYSPVSNEYCGDTNTVASKFSNCIPWNSYKVTPSGYCALVGPSNPNYRESNCPDAARRGVTGYFANQLPPYTTGGSCPTGAKQCFRCEANGGNLFYANTYNCYKGHDFYLNLNFQNQDTPNTGEVSSPMQQHLCSDNDDDGNDVDDDVALSCEHDTL